MLPDEKQVLNPFALGNKYKVHLQNYLCILETYRKQICPRGKVCLEDVSGLPTDPDAYYEDTDIIVD